MAADRRSYHRAYQSTPEYREKRRLYDQKRYQGARRLRMLAQQKAKRQDPEWKARKSAYDKTYYENRRAELSVLRKRRYALERYGQPTLPPRPKKEKPCAPPRTQTTQRSSTSNSTGPMNTATATSADSRPPTSASTAASPQKTSSAPSAPPRPPTKEKSSSGSSKTTTPWIPSFVDRPLIAPPKTPTVFLCSAGHEFPTRRQASGHDRQHRADSAPPPFRQEPFDFQELF